MTTVRLRSRMICPKVSSIVALFECILEKKNIGIETWLSDHPHIKRTTFFDWLAAASGKPVKRKVSVARSRDFEKAILQDAAELGLEILEDLLGQRNDRVQ